MTWSWKRANARVTLGGKNDYAWAAYLKVFCSPQMLSAPGLLSLQSSCFYEFRY